MADGPLLDMIRLEFPGYHPILSMARIANDPSVDVELQFKAHHAVAKYVAPELKSIEVRSLSNDGPRVTVSLFEDAEIISEPILALEQSLIPIPA